MGPFRISGRFTSDPEWFYPVDGYQLADRPNFPIRNESDGDPNPPHASGPAGSVGVDDRCLGQIVVDDVGHFREIHPPPRQVGGDKEVDAVIPETADYGRSFRLFETAVYDFHGIHAAAESLKQPVRSSPGVAEHNRLGNGLTIQIVRQSRRTVSTVDVLEVMLKRLRGQGVRFAIEGQALKVSATNAEARDLCFRLTDVPTGGADLLVAVTARADGRTGYPKEMARQMWVGLAGVGTEKTPERFMTFANARAFTSHFAFGRIGSKTVDLEFRIEGGEAVTLSAVTAHAAADAIYRPYERGVVLANPSLRPIEFDLGRLLPGKRYRRLRGSESQDPKTNNGAAVGAKVTLGAKDALFLVRTGVEGAERR